jgi:hypothetical protein
LLVAVDVQEATAVVFDSYEKEDGTRKSEYGRYGRVKSEGSSKNSEDKAFEHIIRQLIQDGYKETKDQWKEILARIKREFSGA